MKWYWILLIIVAVIFILVLMGRGYGMMAASQLKSNQDKVIGNWNGVPIIQHSTTIGPPNFDYSLG